MKQIAVTGGGTGGHVFPGLAVIEKLQELKVENISIFWIGSSNGMEKELVDAFGIPYYGIPSGKLRRYFSIHNFIDIFKIAAGLIKVFFLLRKLRPDILFSKGGFVSVSPVIAACLLKIPVFTHESDLNPGLATKINSRFTEKIFTGYKETAKYFNLSIRKKVILTGNPVRSSILGGNIEKGRKFLNYTGDKKIILVLGGSQGARQINILIRNNLDNLLAHCFIVHQMGNLMYEKSEKEDYKTYPFILDEFPHILAAADIVISRSGSGALWENAVTGTPAVLVPLNSGSSRGEQILNAEVFKELGAALVFTEENLSGVSFEDTIINLLKDEKKLRQMSIAAKKAGTKQSAENIAGLILNRIK